MTIRDLVARLSLAMIVLPAVAQPASRDWPNGASAIDIEVAAALKRHASGAATKDQRGNAKTASASGVAIYSFDFVELFEGPHQAWFPIPGYPLPGTATAQVQLLGPWQTAQFRLVDESDELLQTISLDGSGNTFLGTIDVPNQPFKFAVSGVDKDSTSYDLVWPVVIKPQALELRFPHAFALVEPGPLSLELEITNHGPSGTFQITAQDDMDLGATPAAAQIEIAQDAKATTSVALTVPLISVGVLNVTVKATATRSGEPANTNHATAVVRTQRFNLLLEDGFESALETNGGAP